jgi:hypothetical protein
MNQAKFDYLALLTHWARATEKYGAEPYIYSTVIEPSEPMYQRVVAMLNYVTFDLGEPTVFLDSDAFLNQDIRCIFDGDWDIGVTYRHNMEMCLNEGVIFANNKRPDAVRSFFRAYLAKYDEIAADPELIAKYGGNLKRWRGGQLSLNAIACPHGLPTALDYREVAGAKVAYFPCFKWNFPAEHIDPRELDTKAIVHLKGGRKHLLDDLIKYQEARHA